MVILVSVLASHTMDADAAVPRSVRLAPVDELPRAPAVARIARVGPIGAPPSDGRIPLSAPESSDASRPISPATPPKRSPRTVAAGRHSAPFLAQYVGQRLAGRDGVGEPEAKAVLLAYLAVTGRTTTYLGFAEPVDLVV